VIEEATEALAEAAAGALPMRQPEDSERFPRTTLPRLPLDSGDPAIAAFEAAAEADEQLSVIWRSEYPGLPVTASHGAFWRVQPSGLGLMIIENAKKVLVFSGGDVNDAEGLKSAVHQAVDDLRVVLAEGELGAVSISAFTGIEVPEGLRVETPWGTLRNAGVGEHDFRPFSDEGPTVVVETPFRVAFRLREPSERVRDQELATVISRLSLLLPLAVLLGIEREDHYVVCSYLWQTAVVPTAQSSSITGGRRFSPRVHNRFTQPTVLSDADVEHAQRWMGRVSEGYDPAVGIAVRRALSAVAERVDPEDALIDAVIACESLFGHGAESEVTFRVTSAITLLLEEDPARRADFRRELVKVYGDRSKVVHGGVVDRKRLNDSKEAAIRTAVQCLRCLFTDYPHLLSDQDRGIRLMLRSEAE
jgi:hypothetical protein